MVNEDIVAGLKNAIAHGENLETAMQLMINSGYNPAEVSDASKFVGGGALNMQAPKPEEQLVMPEKKKGFVSKLKFWKKKSKQAPLQPISPQTKTVAPTPQQNIKPLTKELEKIRPKKSYLKEILLVIILLILIGILVVSIIFRAEILAWFS